MRGTKWTFAAFAAQKGFTLLTTAVLARILAPSDFGLMALVIAITGVILVFSDLGVGGTLVTRRDLTALQVRAIYGVFVVMGPVLGLLGGGFALVLLALEANALAGLLAGAAALLAVSGPSWFYMALVRKEQRFKLQFFALLAQGLVAFAVSVAVAKTGGGVWSLLIGQAAGVLVQFAVLGVGSRYRDRPSFSGHEMRSAVGHGRGFLAQGGIGYIAQNLDNFAVGTLLGSRALGFYSMSYKLAEIPYQGIGNPVYQVMFPRLAADHHAGRDVSPTFGVSVTLIAVLSAPISALFIFCAPWILRVMYGPGWQAAAITLTLLGVWGSIRPFQGAVAWLLNSLGHAGTMARVAAWTLVLSLPALLAAAWLGNIETVAAVMVVDMALSCGVLWYIAQYRAGVNLRAGSWATVRLTVCALAAVGLGRLSVEALPSMNALGSLSVVVLVAAPLYLLLVLVADSTVREFARGIHRRARARPTRAAHSPRV